MRFKIKATSIWNLDEETFHKEMIETYPCLEEFGFDHGCVIIHSLSDLMRLKDAVSKEDNNSLIIYGTMDDPYIEIYDDYRE